MNSKSTFIGIVIGLILGIGVSQLIFTSKETKTTEGSRPKADTVLLDQDKEWKWHDSLDALKAAPESHKIVFEDSTVRILQVILEPKKTEPIHTHQWKSVMWFTQSAPLTYYMYKDTQPWQVSDSIPIDEMPEKTFNNGDRVDAEKPHAIKNRGDKQAVAYRVEFKK